MAAELWVGCSGAHLSRPAVSKLQLEPSDWVSNEEVSRIAGELSLLEPLVRRKLADAWAVAGAELHYGVLTSSRFTLELMAVGAPPELLDQAEIACSSQMSLASRCLSIASACRGEPLGPGAAESAAPLRTTPAELVHAAFLEGILGVGLLKLALGLQRQAATAPWVLDLNQELASACEARLSLAVRSINWLLEEGGSTSELPGILDEASKAAPRVDWSFCLVLPSGTESAEQRALLQAHGLVGLDALVGAEPSWWAESGKQARALVRGRVH